MTDLAIEKEKEIRKSWGVGDKVEVYSKSRNDWFPAKIVEVYTDEDGEWLAVVVEETMIKEVQRFNQDVRPVANVTDSDNDNDTDASESQFESSESEEGASSDEISTSEESGGSDEEKNEKKKKKKKSKKMGKHAESVVIYVERAGSMVVNGKYMYSTTSSGFPEYKLIELPDQTPATENVRIWCDEEQWLFSHNDIDLYSGVVNDDLPPSSGWKAIKGEYPAPGVRLDSQKPKQKEQFFEDDPYKFSPFHMIKHTFNVNEKFGFELQLIESHDQFVAIQSVEENSQAQKLDLQIGDIVVSVGKDDLSAVKSIKEVMKAIEDHVNMILSKVKGGVLGISPEISLTFAREKKVFRVMMVQRGGTKEVDGKYTISGQENGALRFVKNEDPTFRICRIYLSEKQNEAIWALRKDTQDYYIVLAEAKDELPPECGWEAVDPHGLWPAPGLTYYDVNIIPPNKPVIESAIPNPGAVQIRFACDEESRRPKVCPHMDIWYEVECRHIVQATTPTHDRSFQTMSVKATPKKVMFSDGVEAGTSVDDDKMAEDKEKRSRTITVKGSPVVFSKLINGEDYIFTVRTCNQVSSSTSTPSKKVTPLKLPPKPRISDIRGKPNELIVEFSCPNAKAKDVQASFEVIVAPSLDEDAQVYKVKEGRLMVPDDDSKPIRLCGLINGQTYKIIIASVNAVGISYSEPESAYPSLAPPQPQLVSVEAGNREITVHFECPGYDDSQIKAWFEVDLLPEPPEVPSLKTQIDAEAWEEMEKLGAETDKTKKVVKKQHKSTKSRTKAKAKTKGKTTNNKVKKQGEESTPISLSSPGEGEEKQEGSTPMSPSFSASTPGVEEVAPHMRRLTTRARLRKKSTWSKELGEDNLTNEKPLFRRAKRYASSPIRISPLNNGEEYSIRIKAVTLTETKITDFSQGVVPKGVPPMPKIVKLIPRQNSAMIAFECNDYATEEYRAKYEIESIPPTITMKDCTSSPVLFKGLRNGVNYKFTVCGKNIEGRSQWSDQSEGVTPLMIPPQPTFLTCVPFDGEVTVFWVCEELGMPEYQGWYEAISEPPTYTMVTNRQQSRFRFLKNGVPYTFKVFAVNPVARRESDWSSPSQPSDGATKTEYLREKKRVACLMREKVLQERKVRKQKKAQEQQAVHQKKREDLQNLEEKETRNELRKKFDSKKKREDKLAERERKKQQEKSERQKKMDEQRKKVLSNKRRISMIHRERINDMQVQWTSRGGRGNPNTVTSMVAQSMAAADKSKAKMLKNKTDKDSLTLTTEKSKTNKPNSSEQSPKKSNTKKPRPDTKEDEKMD